MIQSHKYRDTPSIIHNNDSLDLPAGKRYEDLKAREKCDFIFDLGIRPTAYRNYPDEKMPSALTGIGQFTRSAFKALQSGPLSESLTFNSDEFREPHPKLIHTYGTTAKILFSPEPGTPYTGILSQTAHGLARFSYAGPVNAIGVVPALALKFPLDGNRGSANLVVMNRLDRQQPWWRFFSKHSYNSVFQNPFSNILPRPRITNLIIQTINSRFQTVVQDGKVLVQPLDDLTVVHTDGSSVEGGRVNTPYRVIFKPTDQVRSSSNPKIDFRDDLGNIKAGTLIYDVLALTEPEEGELKQRGISKTADLAAHATKIGTITTESEFIASKYGDYRLFFKHSDKFLLERYRK